jgi:predicted alpha/beta superfamily hydrolase
VYNTENRVFEYTPVADRERGGGGAHLYADFIVNELKPFVDSSYRTLPDRENTGVMGSSLGGLVSFYLAWEFPGVFSKVGAMSPSYDWAGGAILDAVRGYQGDPKNLRIWIDMGTAEGREHRGEISRILAMHRQMKNALAKQGYELWRDLAYVEDEGGVHSERAWAARLPRALRFLFGTPGDDAE